MRSSHSRLATTIIAALFIAAACTSAATPAPVVTATPTASPSITITTPIPTTGPASPAPATPPTPSPSPSPTVSFVVTVAVTVVDSLRVRSQPRVSDDSIKYDTLLPLDTPLFVLDGPVSASGYDWYEVVPLTSDYLPQGWVASASRDGEPWIADGDYGCPPTPTDYRSLAALPAGVGPACFPRVPITVQARLYGCMCEADYGGYLTPGWLHGGPPSPFLVDPAQTDPPADPIDDIALVLDPAGQYPAVLPIGEYSGDGEWSQPEVVEVTGIFDHPAAAACTWTSWDLGEENAGQPVPTQDCRLRFAVTRLVVIQP